MVLNIISSINVVVQRYRAGSYIWKTSWAPGYRPSMYISIAALGFATVMIIGEFLLSAAVVNFDALYVSLSCLLFRVC